MDMKIQMHISLLFSKAVPHGKKPVNIDYKLPHASVLYPSVIEKKPAKLRNYGRTNSRIVGGVEVEPHSVPHQVHFHNTEEKFKLVIFYLCSRLQSTTEWALVGLGAEDH